MWILRFVSPGRVMPSNNDRACMVMDNIPGSLMSF
jgi:hypothetical protein